MSEQEIHGFVSPGEYRRFVQFVEDNVSSGHFEEIPVDPNYGKGKVFGGRWFKELSTGEIWRLIPPDYPFRGLWEQVES